jgi:predicted ATPase
MKEYITIKNFGPLINIENLDIKPFTILIGESASGKSTLMKVVAMMRYLYKMANIRSYLRHSNITKSPFRMRLSLMMERQGMGKMFKKDSLLVYSVKMDDNTTYEVRVEDGRLVIPTVAKEHLAFCKDSYVSENRNIIPIWAQKASSNKGATLGFYFHETNDDFAKASESDKVLEMAYLGLKMTITHPKGKPVRYQIVPKDGRHNPIELTEASSGIQTSAPLALIVDYMANDFSFKDAFNRSVMSYLFEMERLSKFKAVSEPTVLPKLVYIHIEEPELSLFPDAQCRMIDELIYKATHAKEDRQVNLMLATHSPYILNYMNIILNQKDEGRAQLTDQDTSIYRIYEGTTQNLLMKNEKNLDVVDTYDFSEMMSSIFNEYKELTND